MLIRMASVRWSMPHWRAMQKSSTSCWARTGVQRSPMTHSSITAMRLWLAKHGQSSRPLRLQPVWDTCRYASSQGPNDTKCFGWNPFVWWEAWWLSLLDVADFLNLAWSAVDQLLWMLLVFCLHSKPEIQRTVKLCCFSFPCRWWRACWT